MSHFIYIFVYILNAINAVKKKHGKLILFIFLCLMMLMFCEVTTPTYQHLGYFRGDNEIYEAIYEKYPSMSIKGALNGNFAFGSEKGFILYSYLLAKIGVPFNIYMALTFIWCTALCYVTFRKITSNYSYILMLYFAYYFLFDIQQIRNFIGVSIIIFSMGYLFDGKSFKYMVGVLIASLFHSSMLTYLLFLVVNTKSFDKYSKLIFRTSAFFATVVLFMNLAGLNVIKNFAMSLASVNSSMYIYDKFNVLRPVIEFAMFAYFTFLTHKIHINHLENPIAKKIYHINVVSFLFMPLLLISIVMDRLMRPALLLDYAIFANYYSSLGFIKDGHIYVTKDIVWAAGIIICVFVMYYFFGKTLFTWIFDSNKFIFWLDKIS